MIRIVEVGPRDGLQNEPNFVPTEAKISFVNALSETGARDIEVTAFVSPKWVPQLKDATQVMEGIKPKEGVAYSVLVPNMRGFDRAMEAGVQKIAIFTAASEGFNNKNINTSIDGSFERLAPVVRAAQDAGIAYRGYVSTAFWCPYDGKISPEKAADVIERLADQGVTDVSIGDTIGKAKPDEVRALLDVVLKRAEADRLAMHYHDTFGRASDNVLASWDYGINIYDAVIGQRCLRRPGNGVGGYAIHYFGHYFCHVVWPFLVRSVAPNETAIEHSVLAMIVIDAGSVHAAAIVDQEHIARFPFMGVDEFWFQRGHE